MGYKAYVMMMAVFSLVAGGVLALLGAVVFLLVSQPDLDGLRQIGGVMLIAGIPLLIGGLISTGAAIGLAKGVACPQCGQKLSPKVMWSTGALRLLKAGDE